MDMIQNDDNSYKAVGKPLDSILKIHRHLIPASRPITISAGKIIETYIDEEYYIILITKGHISACRRKDNIALGSGIAPLVLGIIDASSDLYKIQDNTDTYIIADTDCEYYLIAANLFFKKAEELCLWHDISNILARHIILMTTRDRVLVGQDAYAKIRTLLFELYSLPEVTRLDINAQSFIQQRTGLSRSRIMQVLSELKTGGYITILHGRLLDVRTLPASF